MMSWIVKVISARSACTTTTKEQSVLSVTAWVKSAAKFDVK